MFRTSIIFNKNIFNKTSNLKQNSMNILIFRTPCNSVYICIFRPHMYSRMLLSLGIAFIQLSRNEITNMTLTIAKEFYRAYFILFVRSSLEKLSSCLKIMESRIESYIVKFNSLYQEKLISKGTSKDKQ